MIIALPDDLVRVQKSHKPRKNRFAFIQKDNRMVIPGMLIEMFSSTEYGIDLWLSKKEKCAYLKFVPREDSYFKFNPRNGYVSCADLFQWAHNLELPLFEDYDYTDYQVDKKNKVVRVNLVRK